MGEPRKNRGKGGYINNKIEYYDIKTRDFPDTGCTVLHIAWYNAWEHLIEQVGICPTCLYAVMRRFLLEHQNDNNKMATNYLFYCTTTHSLVYRRKHNSVLDFVRQRHRNIQHIATNA